MGTSDNDLLAQLQAILGDEQMAQIIAPAFSSEFVALLKEHRMSGEHLHQMLEEIRALIVRWSDTDMFPADPAAAGRFVKHLRETHDEPHLRTAAIVARMIDVLYSTASISLTLAYGLTPPMLRPCIEDLFKTSFEAAHERASEMSKQARDEQEAADLASKA